MNEVKKIFTSNNCRCIFLIVTLAALLGGLVFFVFGGARLSQSRIVWDSERDAEFSRQAGLISEFAETIGGGLGALHESLGAIQGELGSGATDLRGMAGRLLSIAAIVEAMENDLDSARGRLREFELEFGIGFGSELEPE